MRTHRSGMSPMSWRRDPCQCPGNTDPSHVMSWQHGPLPMSWQHEPFPSPGNTDPSQCPGNTERCYVLAIQTFPCPGNTDLSHDLATRTFPLSWQQGPFPLRFYLSFCWRGLRGCQTCALHSAQLAVRETNGHVYNITMHFWVCSLWRANVVKALDLFWDQNKTKRTAQSILHASPIGLRQNSEASPDAKLRCKQ